MRPALPLLLIALGTHVLGSFAYAQSESPAPPADPRFKQCAESSLAAGLKGKSFDDAVLRCAQKAAPSRLVNEDALTARILQARDLAMKPEGKAYSEAAYRAVVSPTLRRCKPQGVPPEALPPLRIVVSVQASGAASNVVVQAGGTMRECVQSTLEASRWPALTGQLPVPHAVSYDIYFAPPAGTTR